MALGVRYLSPGSSLAYPHFHSSQPRSTPKEPAHGRSDRDKHWGQAPPTGRVLAHDEARLGVCEPGKKGTGEALAGQLYWLEHHSVAPRW